MSRHSTGQVQQVRPHRDPMYTGIVRAEISLQGHSYRKKTWNKSSHHLHAANEQATNEARLGGPSISSSPLPSRPRLLERLNQRPL